MTTLRDPCVLTIAGSDSGGGAGVQADLKTFAAYGVHGVSAITALTAQHTRGVCAVHVPPTAFLEAQIEAVFADFRVGAVKLGMLADKAVIDAVAAALDRHRPRHVVLDPVMVASSGARLLEASALEALRERLVPRATVLTPNLPEAELLLGRRIADERAAAEAVADLLSLGAAAVLLKGGHMPDGHSVQARGCARERNDVIVDRYAQGAERAAFTHERLAVEGHGTGCTLASAIAANVALGRGLHDACEDAVEYVYGALRHAYSPGLGALAVLDHLWRLRAGHDAQTRPH